MTRDEWKKWAEEQTAKQHAKYRTWTEEEIKDAARAKQAHEEELRGNRLYPKARRR